VLSLLTPLLRWYLQSAATRRRFYLYEKGLVCTSPAATIAVPWENVDEVLHRSESRRSAVRTVTTYFEVLRLSLRPTTPGQPTRRMVDPWPVAYQRAMTRDVRRLTGGTARWTELAPNWPVYPAFADRPAFADQPGGATAVIRDALADAQTDQARRRDAARTALAQRLACYGAENAAVADDLTMADREFADGQVQAAFERLLGVIGQKSGEERDRARMRLLDLFDAAPPQDPRVASARAALCRLLF
jgi:hypothetical protein